LHALVSYPNIRK